MLLLQTLLDATVSKKEAVPLFWNPPWLWIRPMLCISIKPLHALPKRMSEEERGMEWTGEREWELSVALWQQHPQPCHGAFASRAACVRWDKPKPSCLGGIGWSRSTRRQLSPTTNPIEGLSLTRSYFHFLPRSLYLSLPHSLSPWLFPSSVSPSLRDTAYSFERSVFTLPSNHCNIQRVATGLCCTVQFLS